EAGGGGGPERGGGGGGGAGGGGGQRHRRFRHLGFHRSEPAGIERQLGEQPVAFAHGAFELADPNRMGGVESGDEPVEKTPAVAGRAGEQPVHCRRQPEDPGVPGEGGPAPAEAAG